MRGSLDVEDHHISLTELFAKYKTDPRFGLTKAEAEARLAKHGKNVITPNKKGFRTRRFFRRVFYASTVVRFIMILISLFDIVLHKIQDDIAAELCINLLIMIFNNSVVGVCYYVQVNQSKDLIICIVFLLCRHNSRKCVLSWRNVGENNITLEHWNFTLEPISVGVAN